MGSILRAKEPTPRVKEVQLAAGERVGKYRIVRRLGLGGMGAVFEAVHEQIRSRVAIKVLYPHYSENPQMVARFFNEARAVNIVRHPSIVSSFEVGHLQSGAAAGSAYIVMEYLDGESLAARLKRLGGPLGADTLRISRQIAAALATAHSWGVIHRDLKPGNVMLVPDPEMAGGERVKVLDFGLAKIAAELEDFEEAATQGFSTYAGAILGTPAYMAPEQCQEAATVDEKADVYSLGIILYECLSGRLPFSAKGAVDLMAMHIHVPPPPLQELLEGAHPDLPRLVHTMLAKRPEERPTMAEVVAELERLDSGTAGSQRPGAPLPIPAVRIQEPTPIGRRVLLGLITGLAVVGALNLGRALLLQRAPALAAPPAVASSPAPASVMRASPAPAPATAQPAQVATAAPPPAPPRVQAPPVQPPPARAPAERPRRQRALFLAGKQDERRDPPSADAAPAAKAAQEPAAPAPPSNASRWTDEKIKIFK
jgi:serine/threonine-protein kinase